MAAPGLEGEWLMERLSCPRGWGELSLAAGTLVCVAGHAYPVVHGIPVMLLAGEQATHRVMA